MRRVALVVPAVLAALACGTPSPRTIDMDPPPPQTEDDPPADVDRVCEGGLCFDDETASHLATVRAALDACVPDADAAIAPADALRVGGVAVGVGDFGDELRIDLANIGGVDVLSYPGILVQVGGGPIDFGRGENTLFGVTACSATDVPVPFTWTTEDVDATATVTIAATNDLGEVETDAIVVEIVR